MWELVRPGRSRASHDAAPKMRCKHAMCLHEEDGYMYLYGGRNGNLPLKDFWKYDPLNNDWVQLKRSKNCPPSLQEHTIVAWQNQIFVFGGEVGFASSDQTPLWIYNIDTALWKIYQQDDFSSVYPTGRRGHTAVTFYNSMYIYGGYQDLHGSTNELWIYSFEDDNWILHPSSKNFDSIPAPRHNHSAVVHDGAMWVYGGMTDLQQKGDFWKLEFDTGNWFRMRSKTGPGEIHSHSAAKVMSVMLIFGGLREGVFINELWRYHFGIDVWEKIQIEGILPSPCARPVVIPNPDLDLSPSSTSMFSESHSKWSSQMSCAVKTPTSGFPSKSVSMYSSFTSQAEDQPIERIGNKRHFRSRIHPVSRLCSKSISSDEEEEDVLDKDSGYRSAAGSRIIPSSQSQVNLRAIRDKISSHRLVRSISGSSYSILNNRYSENQQDENQCPIDAHSKNNINVPNKRCVKNVYKSHSSDALLEADDESTSSSTDATTADHNETILPGSVHQTTSFYNIHSCDNGCDEHSYCQQKKMNSALINFENSPKRPHKSAAPPLSAQYEKNSNSEESCHLNVNSSSSNLSNPHKDFASCLNTANKKRDASKSNFRYSLNVELKTFTPDTSPYRCTTRLATTPGSMTSSRSKSLDREAHKREAFSFSPHISSTPLQNRSNVSSFYGSQYMKPPPRLCMYVFGGRDQGTKTEYKQPLSCWLLHL